MTSSCIRFLVKKLNVLEGAVCRLHLDARIMQKNEIREGADKHCVNSASRYESIGLM